MGRIEKAPSNIEWRKWGEVDPFYGVASWSGRERGGANPWTAEEFFALGLSDWADFRDRWVRYGVKFGRVVDLGCGAGRLTRFMAGDFARVVGVDVSKGMLEMARSHVPDANVDLRQGDGVTLPVESATADGVFSAHVFQHFDSLALALTNFTEVARVLKPGGTMMVHLPVVIPPVGLPGILPVLAAKRKIGQLLATAQRRRGAPLMRGLQYPWGWLRRELRTLGLVDVELVVFAAKSNGGDHACVLARRVEE
jgi:ubiquinone/menaquinone biosynthesis C-methylase UbiE